MSSRRSLFDKLNEHSLLIPVSGRPHTLQSDSPHSSLPTWTRASQNPDTRKLTPDHQKKRVEKWAQCESHSHATTIDTLTDNVLLEVFDHIRRLGTSVQVPVWKWHRLAHVCQRWRQIIFESPLRLDLQLLCTHGISVRKDLGCWPAFPIVIDYIFWQDFAPNGGDRVVAALEHPDRVRQLKLTVASSLWRKMTTAIKEPFPTLTHLSILSDDRYLPILPGIFMGGSAPCLREIRLNKVPIPTLSNLLSSASNLVKLELVNIPLTGYISPAALVACLVVLPKLGSLSIAFQSRALRADRINLFPETRVVLPALTSFSFEGKCAYLEDFVARIDTPRLDSIDITYTDRLDFRVPQLPGFINRSGLRKSRLRRAEIHGREMISLHLFREVGPQEFAIAIHISSCEGIDEGVRHMTQVLSQTSAMLLDVVRLDIKSDWGFVEHMDDIEWLELLRPFTAVQLLRVSGEFADSVAHAFRGMTVEITAHVLPALDLLYLEDQLAWTIKKIFAIFRGCGRTLTIVGKERTGSEGIESENDPYW
ncbi:hypothetical protein EDB85DRAFT_1965454 [Lactarius pseudohatsudake]|nr:hypothetical protein EDB85DRAFT_1965454 [Lactarius pseudohatsudake]